MPSLRWIQEASWRVCCLNNDACLFFSRESDMNIQSGYGALVYQTINNITLQQAGGSVAKSPTAEAARNAASADTADRVTLSSAARELAAKENNATQTRTPAQEKLLAAAGSDRQSAEKIARDLADSTSTIFFNLRDSILNEVRTLSTSGRIVDDDFIARFQSGAAQIDAQRRAICESEKAKGTDPVEILSMMIDFTNSQSKDYLEATGWGWRGSSPPA